MDRRLGTDTNKKTGIGLQGKGITSKDAKSQQPTTVSEQNELSKLLERVYEIQGKKLEIKDPKHISRLFRAELDEIDINLKKMKDLHKAIKSRSQISTENEKAKRPAQKGNKSKEATKGTEISIFDFIVEEFERLQDEIEDSKKEIKAEKLKKVNLTMGEKERTSPKEEKNMTDLLDEILQLAEKEVPLIYKKQSDKTKKTKIDLFAHVFPEVVARAKDSQDLAQKVEKLEKEKLEMEAELLKILDSVNFTIPKEERKHILPNVTECFNRLQGEKAEQKKLLDHILQTMDKAVQYSTDITRPGKMDKDGFRANNGGNSEEIQKFNKKITSIMEQTQAVHTRVNEEVKQSQTVEALKSENEALQLRLSKVAGSRLTEGNPNITNLGDPNRPMRIGEMYSEMYDNEWTDVIDQCTKALSKKNDEEKVVKTLYHTVIWCYKMSEETVKKFLNDAKSEVQRVLHIKGYDDEITIQVKPALRHVAADTVFQMIKSSKDRSKMLKDSKIDRTIFDKVILESKYLQKCLNVCWKMVVQDPQMYLQEGPPEGLGYDRNVFREYTSSGSKVVFTIWPALYLHKGGPLLVKGVVKVQ